MSSYGHAGRLGVGGTILHRLADWTTEDDRMFVSARAGLAATTHMTVERMAGGGWEWLVWQSRAPSQARSGVCASAQAAMLRAERAARELDRGGRRGGMGVEEAIGDGWSDLHPVC
jgi:hypothetical protein